MILPCALWNKVSGKTYKTGEVYHCQTNDIGIATAKKGPRLLGGDSFDDGEAGLGDAPVSANKGTSANFNTKSHEAQAVCKATELPRAVPPGCKVLACCNLRSPRK